MKKWKKAIGIIGIIFSLESFGAIGTVSFKTVLQNTTNDDLDISYSTCTWSLQKVRWECFSPSFIHLPAKSSNYQNPIIIDIPVTREWNGEPKLLGVETVTNSRTHISKNFKNSCGAQGQARVHFMGLITFSTLIDNPNVLICTSGYINK